MSIRTLLKQSTTSIVQRIFSTFPAEIDCFCSRRDHSGLHFFHYNAFDLTLLGLKSNSNQPSQMNLELNRVKSQLHAIFIKHLVRDQGVLYPSDSHPNIQYICSPMNRLEPSAILLEEVSIIGKKYPLLYYKANQGINEENPKDGITCYRSVEHFETAIKNDKSDERFAKENYPQALLQRLRLMASTSELCKH